MVLSSYTNNGLDVLDQSRSYQLDLQYLISRSQTYPLLCAVDQSWSCIDIDHRHNHSHVIRDDATSAGINAIAVAAHKPTQSINGGSL